MSRAGADIAIRAATAADAAVVAAIYAWHVENGTGTFDTSPPDSAFMADKIANHVARGWPFLVAERDGVVIGYAYAAQFRDRAAYGFTCEDSIYIASDARGHGVGKTLLAALISASTESGFRQMLAVIGGGEPASVALHASLGFEHVGRINSVGRKFGRWLDVVFMQLALGEGDDAAPASEPA